MALASPSMPGPMTGLPSKLRALLLFFVVACAGSPPAAPPAPPPDPPATAKPAPAPIAEARDAGPKPAPWPYQAPVVVRSSNGMVVSDNAAATKVGRDVLASGGNAVDAAVALAFALAVTYPTAGNIGG